MRSLGWAVSAAILALSCGGSLGGVLKTPNPVTATTVLTADRGSVVFSDDFKDSASGWNTQTYADFTASFTKSGYVVIARRFVDHEVASPYGLPKDQVSVSATATELSSSPTRSGFGAGCTRGIKDPTVHYDFVVTVGGSWEMYRYDLRGSGATQHVLLKEGTSPKAAGAVSLTAELMCATLADQISTRLAMFVNGTNVADITDPVSDLPKGGWWSGLVVRGEDSGPTTVTATHFEVRDLTV